MDTIYTQQSHQAMWQGVMPMDYTTYSHPSFTSPPATPMTPVTLHHAFPVPQYEIQPPAAVYHPTPAPPPPFPPPPDYRLYDLCQELQGYSKTHESEVKLWWEKFMAEFFHENSTLAIEVDLGDGTRKFCLTSQWISLYFRSLMENGVTSLYLNLGQCFRTFHQTMQQLESRTAVMETDHATPQPTKVCTSGTLIVDFSLEDKPRIISWYFYINDHVEYIPRTNSGTSTETGIAGNITCMGILPATQKLLMEAGMMESGYKDPTLSVSPTASSESPAPLHWSDAMPNLQPAPPMEGTLHCLSPTTTQSLLHSTTQPPQTPPVLNSTGMVISSGGQHPSSQMSCSPPGISSCNSSSCNSNKARISRQSSSSLKRGKSSPSAKKSQFILVAAKAVPLTEADEVLAAYGLDERAITRVNNSEKEDSGEKAVPLKTKKSCAMENGQKSEGMHSSLWETENFGMGQQTVLASTL